MSAEAESDGVRAIHADVDAAAAPLVERLGGRLQCRRGCHDCCRDGLTVFEVEAERIRKACASLLRAQAPHPPGACAFLDAEGACRIYAHRPYVCRTQGLPLRWVDPEAGLEQRDICPKNAAGSPLVELAADSCWELGPTEARLAALQARRDGGALRRVALRDLWKA